MPSVEISNVGAKNVAMRRFKRLCEREGIPSSLKKREAYEKPTTKRRRLAAAARKRTLRKLQKETIDTRRRGRAA